MENRPSAYRRSGAWQIIQEAGNRFLFCHLAAIRHSLMAAGGRLLAARFALALQSHKGGRQMPLAQKQPPARGNRKQSFRFKERYNTNTR